MKIEEINHLKLLETFPIEISDIIKKNEGVFLFGGSLISKLAEFIGITGIDTTICDYDILCLPKTKYIIKSYLDLNNFLLNTPSSELEEKELEKYKSFSLPLRAPCTLKKKQIKIQLLSPAILPLARDENFDLGFDTPVKYNDKIVPVYYTLYHVLKNVDISLSSLVLSNKGLFEIEKGALNDLRNKQFRYFEDHLMAHKKEQRIEKYIKKGFTLFENKINENDIFAFKKMI